jgi:plasmid stabilization system protein ParE
VKGVISRRCRAQVKKAAEYIRRDSPMQADILIDTFNEKAIAICKNPETGMPWEDGIRRLRLGKFKYSIFYKTTKDKVYFLGIHSMRRGSKFEP